MSEVIAQLEPELVFSTQAEATLRGRPRPERRRITREIEKRAKPLLRMYQLARRRIPPALTGNGVQRWLFVRLQDYVALVNLYGTQVRVHLVYHRAEQERWHYVQCLFRFLEQKQYSSTTRILEITLSKLNVVTQLRVYFIRGERVREWATRPSTEAFVPA